MLYTDGLVERRGDTLDEMLEALTREVAARRGVPVGTLLSELVDTLVGSGERDDDVCVLCLEYVAGGAAATA